MRNFQLGVVLSSFGVAIGVVWPCLLCGVLGIERSAVILLIMRKKTRPRAEELAIRVYGADLSTIPSDFKLGRDSPRTFEWSNMPRRLEGLKRKRVASACGIPKYSYKELQKATCDFTTKIGEGAFGPVYKGQMATGQTVAVKVRAAYSRQGAMEFLTEIPLLGRLHHRNPVNLVGY